MTTDRGARPSMRAWTRATLLGWILGVPCVAAIALLGEVVGIGGAQALVGAGMGVGMGWTQARMLRSFGIPAAPWMLACVIGFGLPFLGWDIAKALGSTWTYSLFVLVSVGGLVTGALQAFVLRRNVAAVWWLLASAVGWGLAGLLVTQADSIPKGHAVRGLAGAGLYLALVASGGLAIGLVTGAVLASRWREQRTEPAPATS